MHTDDKWGIPVSWQDIGLFLQIKIVKTKKEPQTCWIGSRMGSLVGLESEILSSNAALDPY